MSTILEKPIKVNRIITTSMEHARALEDPARAKIVAMLYRRALNAEQIANELKKSGYKKALTTIRHHLEILKSSGLIEIVKIDEARGAVTKFYGTQTKLLDYDIPKDFDSKYSKAITSTSDKLEKILKGITPKTNSKKKSSDDYSKYVLMEIINRAVTNLLENNSSK